MDRRDFFLTLLAAAALAESSIEAAAQAFDGNPVDGQALAKSFADPAALDRVMLDVAYVHSWRVELAPRGYEAENDWKQLAAANRQLIWQNLSDGRAAQGIARAFETGMAQDFEAQMLKSFEEQKGAFYDFLESFGLSSDSKGAARIVQSLRDYGLLNVAALGDGAGEAAKHSFYWPFC